MKKYRPPRFGPMLIENFIPDSYAFFNEYLRLKNGDIDWDLVTICLDRSFQKRWRADRALATYQYTDENEVNDILDSYKSKLYTLAVPLDATDKLLRDRILTRLVRTAQRGNEAAKKQVVSHTNFIIYDWMENSKHMARWRGYESELEKKIGGCIRNYRYSGSFTTYLFMTLYYSARALRQTQSLDAPVGKTRKARIEFVVMDENY